MIGVSTVVTAQEMARVEKLAIAQGCSEEAFMEEAGGKIARVAMEFGKKRVGLLVGRGNNGGDAYVAGRILLEAGWEVEVWAMQGERSALNRLERERFLAQGGMEGRCKRAELLIDGLLGTGFHGKVEGEIAEATAWANGAGLPVIAIDIPSGLNGTTGEGGGIRADVTVALGFAKSGLFLQEGWNWVGQVRVESFGLPEAVAEQAEAFGYLVEAKAAAHLLPPIVRARHKYQAGYVVGFSGSEQFKGAPKMAGLAALRSGAGIVRMFHRGETPFRTIAAIARSAWARKARKSLMGSDMGLSTEASAGGVNKR